MDIWDILFTVNYYPEGKWYNADFWDVIAERCLFCREQKIMHISMEKRKGWRHTQKKLILVTLPPASGKTYI